MGRAARWQSSSQSGPRTSEVGATLVEYAAVMALVGLLAVAGLAALGTLAIDALAGHAECSASLPASPACSEVAP